MPVGAASAASFRCADFVGATAVAMLCEAASRDCRRSHEIKPDESSRLKPLLRGAVAAPRSVSIAMLRSPRCSTRTSPAPGVPPIASSPSQASSRSSTLMRRPSRLHRRGSEMPSGSRASSASSASVVDGKRDVTRRFRCGHCRFVVRHDDHRNRLRGRRAAPRRRSSTAAPAVGLRVIGGQAAARDVVFDQQEARPRGARRRRPTRLSRSTQSPAAQAEQRRCPSALTNSTRRSPNTPR